MSDLHGARIAVVGGGVLGFSAALSVAMRGGSVVLYEAEAPGDNASGVAAGMLAPAFETVLDPLSSGHFTLLRDARDCWPQLIDRLQLSAEMLDRSGAVWVARPSEAALLDAITDRLASEGAAAEALTVAELSVLQPTLGSNVIGGVFTPQDWLIDPRRLLTSLSAALQQAGGDVIRAEVSLNAGALKAAGADICADAVVLAAGAGGAGLSTIAPELRALRPVKGQILHLDVPPISGPVVRGSFGYVAPQTRGAVVGATMQAGLVDRLVDSQVLASLQAGAAQLFPHLTDAPAKGFAGVRASTPDGLPLVGPSSRPGLLLALGARRNGWLLGPMIGEMIAAYLLGEDPGLHAAAMNPLRAFDLGVQV